MARQYPKPKRKRDATWFRDKVLLVEAQGNGKVLNEEESKFLADLGIVEGPVTQSVITHNVAYQADEFEAYDSDYDDFSTAKAVLMANLSSYGSDVLSEVPHSEHTHNDMLNQSVQEMQYSKQTHLVNYPVNERTSDSNILPYSQYLLETQNAVVQDTNSSAQNDAMILSVFKQLSNQVTNCNKVNKDNLIAKESISTDLERYKERNNTSVNQTEPSFDQLFELNNLKAELQAEDITIKKLKANIKRLNKTSTTYSVKKDIDEIETINIELEHKVTKLIAENAHLKQTYKQLYDSIKPSHVQAKEHAESLVNQLNQRKFKGKDIVDNAAQVSNATTIALEMYKLDPVTLAPKDKNNRETHLYYLKHTMEQAATLKEIVEQAYSLNPLDSVSYSACKYVKLIQELLGYVRDTCPNIHKLSEKLVIVMPINKKTIRFVEPVISSRVSKSTKSSRLKSIDNKKNDRTHQISSTTQKKNKVEDYSRIIKSSLYKKNYVEPSVNENSKLMCVKCNSYMFDGRHELYFLKFVSDMNASSKSKSVKETKRKEEWKPTGKVFTKIGYA
nr:hypothetical protein [Tanacetum cinerariifolium]